MLGVTGCLPASKTRARPTVSARASNCSISKISTVRELWPWWYTVSVWTQSVRSPHVCSIYLGLVGIFARDGLQVLQQALTRQGPNPIKSCSKSQEPDWFFKVWLQWMRSHEQKQKKGFPAYEERICTTLPPPSWLYPGEKDGQGWIDVLLRRVSYRRRGSLVV